MLVAGVTRTDTEIGLREEAEFLSSGDQPLFGFRHMPLRQARGGVLVCSPVLAEFGRNYRREFALGRCLAADGFAVQRFHYRGTGNSGGEAADVSLGSLQEDAEVAGRRLAEVSGLPVAAVIGTRLGAFVAARVAVRLGVDALILWEPLVDGAHQFREAFRARLFHDLWESTAPPQSREALSKELIDRGRVDVLGYTIHRALYESLVTRNLAQELESPPPSVLIVPIGDSAQRKTSYEQVAATCARKGSSVFVRMVAHEETWWLGEREEAGSVASQMTSDEVDLTRDWMIEVFGPGAPS
jgi:pimeloyl-ACP methyl ester carboxylesterase